MASVDLDSYPGDSSGRGIESFGAAFLCLLLSVASVGKYFDIWQGEGPPLAFPFEVIAQRGREIAVVLLGVIAVVAFLTSGYLRPAPFPLSCRALIGIQAVLCVKFSVSGSAKFAVIALFVYIASWWVYAQSFPRILGGAREAPRRIADIFFVVLAIFLAANLYQFVVDPVAVTMSQGRFHGLTGNPQMFALSVGVLFPAAAFIALDVTAAKVKRCLAAHIIFVALLLILLSGSRLAVLLVIVGIAPYLSSRVVLLGAVLVAVAWALDFDLGSASGNADQFNTILRANDSRTSVWSAQLRTFERFPVFGEPIESERIRFGESSWLALLAVTGLVGSIPGAIFLFSLFSLMIRSWESRLFVQPIELANVPKFLSGSIAVLIVGSFFEAFMLGTLSTALFSSMILIYGATAYLRGGSAGPR